MGVGEGEETSVRVASRRLRTSPLATRYWRNAICTCLAAVCLAACCARRLRCRRNASTSRARRARYTVCKRRAAAQVSTRIYSSSSTHIVTYSLQAPCRRTGEQHQHAYIQQQQHT
jgi:hypothetical protein